MDPVLYTGLDSAKVDFNRQGITANNLANVNTPGFKADLYAAQTKYTGSSDPHNLNYQGHLVEESNQTDLTPGKIMTTGRDLDVAIDGEGWIAVQDSTGKEAYTRAGNLQIDANGQLTTASGRPVLGDGGPISIPPAKKVEIGSDGTISVIPLDGGSNELAVLDRIKVVTARPADLYKGLEGLMMLQPGATAQPDAKVKVVSGSLESSNVNAVDQMVKMISSGREYDASLKLMQTIDEISQRLAQVMHD